MWETAAVLAQATSPNDGAASGGMSLIEFVQAGGTIGLLIVLLSVAAVSLGVMHLLQIRSDVLAPPELIARLRDAAGRRAVREVRSVCEEPSSNSFLARVFGAGLSRAARSPLGMLELGAVIEESGQAEVARLYRSTDGLALIAGIAPMLGLLGTVVGINGAFSTMSASEGFARPEQLAGDISLALVTTIMGLVLAIPTTAAVTFFRNRIDALAARTASIAEELAAQLESAAAAQPAGGAVRPASESRAPRPEAPGGVAS